ncbi:MAG: two-component system response regulator [Rhodospirillaceae bacterium]|nr:MAG: two-component system response regulator [Rhodospirillaceae bacterium]
MPNIYSDEEEPSARLFVLVADSSAQMRKIIHNILMHSIGVARVFDAADGERALDVLSDSPCDLLILDVEMRPLGGIELARRIRNNEEKVDPFVPIIITSSTPAIKDVAGARDAGGTEYLAKPLSAKILNLRIQSLINKPRPFVKSESFFGPDRRRHTLDDNLNDERRSQEPEIIEPS